MDHFLKSLLNLLQYHYFVFVFWILGHGACETLAPRPRIEPTPPALEDEVLTTGPQGSLCFIHSCQVVLVVKNLPVNAGNIKDEGSVLESGRYPAERNGNPLQYSCLENLMNRGAWWATVHRISKNQTLLMQLSKQICRTISVQFSHSVMSNSLRPHGLQHTRLPCPSPTPGVCSNSCPSSQ